jgi:4-amino-4-deoxy-L-arabinose transferase-like glycosyltransferase
MNNIKPKRSTVSDITVLLLVSLIGSLVHILLNGQYGFHRDELDIIMNARQLSWGYVAYPPLTPFIARLSLMLFGESLRGLRLFPAISQGVVMLLTGLMARDMGGSRRAQVIAAVAVGIAPVALTAGTLIQYMSFDYLWWVVIAFFFVRLLATEDPRYWLGIGAGIGLGMMTKFTIAFWVAGLAIAFLLSSRRKDVFSKWLWLGAALALLIYLPNLIWQIQHDFISLDFLRAIHARDLEWGRGNDFLPSQLHSSTNPFTVPIWITGLFACLFSASLKRFRPLAWMFLTTFTIFFIARGRFYYVAPSYGMLLAAGSAWIVNWLESRNATFKRYATIFLSTWIAVGTLAAIIMIKPVAPINSPLWKITSGLNAEIVEMVGWDDLASQVSAIYQAIPESEKTNTVILAGNYGEAGALDLYSHEYTLPRVISGADSFWYRGYGSPDPQTVILVGFDRSYANQFFTTCTTEGMVSNRYNVSNEESSRHTGLYVCREPRRPWSELWQQMLWFQ